MTSNVCFERGRPDEGGGAVVTFEWSLTSVGPGVIAQVTMRCKRNLANQTFVWFDTSMDSHVYLEITAFSELLLAGGAFKGFYVIVGPYVDFETASPRVCFVTLGAFEWQFARVNQLMRLQVTPCNK